MFSNIPEVKLGMIAVSRDCFPISVSDGRSKKVVEECAKLGLDVFLASTIAENECDAMKAAGEVNAAGCTALVVFLGNFGPETPETIIAKSFDAKSVLLVSSVVVTNKNLIKRSIWEVLEISSAFDIEQSYTLESGAVLLDNVNDIVIVIKFSNNCSRCIIQIIIGGKCSSYLVQIRRFYLVSFVKILDYILR